MYRQQKRKSGIQFVTADVINQTWHHPPRRRRSPDMTTFSFNQSRGLYFDGAVRLFKHSFILCYPNIKPLSFWVQLSCRFSVAVRFSSNIKLEHVSKFHCTIEAKSPVLITGDLRILQEEKQKQLYYNDYHGLQRWPIFFFTPTSIW